MSLKDDLITAPKARSGPPCGTCDWYAGLDAQSQKDFDDYVSAPDYNRALLYRVIRDKWGYTPCDSSLKYHLAFHHESR